MIIAGLTNEPLPNDIFDLMNGDAIVMSGLRYEYDDPQPLSPLAQFIAVLESNGDLSDVS